VRAAVVLAAHGAGDGSEANGIIRRHAQSLAAAGLFDEVAVTFRRGAPAYAEVLDGIAADRVAVVPFLAAGGWFCDVVLPRELARNRRFPGVDLRVTRPVGADPRMARIALERAEAAVRREGLDPAATAVLFVGHGTARHASSRSTTEEAAAAAAARKGFAAVSTAYLEESPSPEEALAALGGLDVVAVPFFIGGGRHVEEDLRRRLGGTGDPGQGPDRRRTSRPARRVVIEEAVGMDARIAAIALDLAREALQEEQP
jgi:sirohydrochlorin cobaltochelatase